MPLGGVCRAMNLGITRGAPQGGVASLRVRADEGRGSRAGYREILKKRGALSAYNGPPLQVVTESSAPERRSAHLRRDSPRSWDAERPRHTGAGGREKLWSGAG